MRIPSRRIFLLQLAATGSAMAVTTTAPPLATGALLDEKDPQAVALAYAKDTTKVDAKKQPKHSKDQKCGNCMLYGGKPADAAGPCPLFAGKQVAAAGWCSAWVKKAA